MTPVGGHHQHHERASCAVLRPPRGIRGHCLTPHPPRRAGAGGSAGAGTLPPISRLTPQLVERAAT